VRYGSPKLVSEHFDIPLQTLANWRSQKKFLPFSKVGRKVLYDLKEIEKIIQDGHIKAID